MIPLVLLLVLVGVACARRFVTPRPMTMSAAWQAERRADEEADDY